MCVRGGIIYILPDHLVQFDIISLIKAFIIIIMLILYAILPFIVNYHIYYKNYLCTADVFLIIHDVISRYIVYTHVEACRFKKGIIYFMCGCVYYLT